MKDVVARQVHTCNGDDDVRTAIATTQRAGVRRLPVVGEGGILEGIIGLNDFVLAAGGKRNGINSDEVMATIKAVSQHHGSRLTWA